MKSVLRHSVLLGLLLCVATLSPRMPSPDAYPGDAPFTQIIQDLRAAAQNDTMHFPWAGRSGMTRRQLCQTLVGQHLDGRNTGMAQTNTAWVNGSGLTRQQLDTACLDALTNPQGFASAAGWNVWQGTHWGVWFTPEHRFEDEARWSAPRRVPTNVEGDNDRAGQPRVYDGQQVHWPGRSDGRFGWNQSHPDVPYLWGWDPKENGNENGMIGAHLGFRFDVGSCRFIVWITPKTAFFEAINTAGQVTRTVNDQQVHGFPKASTALSGPNGAGFGQWLVAR